MFKAENSCYRIDLLGQHNSSLAAVVSHGINPTLSKRVDDEIHRGLSPHQIIDGLRGETTIPTAEQITNRRKILVKSGWQIDTLVDFENWAKHVSIRTKSEYDHIGDLNKAMIVHTFEASTSKDGFMQMQPGFIFTSKALLQEIKIRALHQTHGLCLALDGTWKLTFNG